MPAAERVQPVAVWLLGLLVGTVAVGFGGALLGETSLVEAIALAIAAGVLAGALAARRRDWRDLGELVTAGGLGGLGFTAGAVGLLLLAIGSGATCLD
jgi:hypothetical protein